MKSLKYSPNYIEKVEIWSFLKFTVLGKILIFLFTDKVFVKIHSELEQLKPLLFNIRNIG